MSIRPLALISLFLLAPAPGPTPLRAQTRDRGPLLLELPASTRALGLGRSFALVSRNPDALFHHPGLLDQAQGLSAAVQRFSSRGTLASVSGGNTWYGGGVALGIQHLSYGAPGGPIVRGEDVLALPADEASLRRGGAVGVSELAVSAGYGRRLKGVRMGVVGKFLEQRFGGLRGSTAALDLGAATTAGPFTGALAVQNLGPALTMGGVEIPLPLRFSLGATSRPYPLGPLDVSATGGVSYRMDGDLTPSMGIEVGYWPVTGRTFVGRLGVRRVPEGSSTTPLSAGAAFWGDNILLEYAFQPFDAGAGSHRFGVGWR